MILTQRVHPFPFRTRKLSSAVAKILVWRRTGKIAHCRHRESGIVGVFNAKGPPVPIPNTEVKLCCGENTYLATSREDRSTLTQKSVILTQRVHPFPFRTRKLSSAVATILVWRRTGKIAHCQHKATLRVERGVTVKRNPFKNFTRKSVFNSLPVFHRSCRSLSKLSTTG